MIQWPGNGMQIIEQSKKNDAGAPMSHLEAPKGLKEAKMVIILNFLFFHQSVSLSGKKIKHVLTKSHGTNQNRAGYISKSLVHGQGH